MWSHLAFHPWWPWEVNDLGRPKHNLALNVAKYHQYSIQKLLVCTFVAFQPFRELLSYTYDLLFYLPCFRYPELTCLLSPEGRHLHERWPPTLKMGYKVARCPKAIKFAATLKIKYYTSESLKYMIIIIIGKKPNYCVWDCLSVLWGSFEELTT